MAVEYIHYNGEELPIKIGYYTLKMLQQEHGVDLTSIDNNFANYEPMLFYSLKQGHKIDGKEFKFKMEDMVDILDDCFFEFIDKISNFFPDDLLEKMTGEVGQETKPKKKGR